MKRPYSGMINEISVYELFVVLRKIYMINCSQIKQNSKFHVQNNIIDETKGK